MQNLHGYHWVLGWMFFKDFIHMLIYDLSLTVPITIPYPAYSRLWAVELFNSSSSLSCIDSTVGCVAACISTNQCHESELWVGRTFFPIQYLRYTWLASLHLILHQLPFEYDESPPVLQCFRTSITGFSMETQCASVHVIFPVTVALCL